MPGGNASSCADPRLSETVLPSAKRGDGRLHLGPLNRRSRCCVARLGLGSANGLVREPVAQLRKTANPLVILEENHPMRFLSVMLGMIVAAGFVAGCSGTCLHRARRCRAPAPKLAASAASASAACHQCRSRTVPTKADHADARQACQRRPSARHLRRIVFGKYRLGLPQEQQRCQRPTCTVS